MADLGRYAVAFLVQVHDGEVADARGIAELHLRRLREFVRRSGVSPDEIPSYRAHTATWRAVARLAHPVAHPSTQAG
jgi:hypothetical protein